LQHKKYLDSIIDKLRYDGMLFIVFSLIYFFIIYYVFFYGIFFKIHIDNATGKSKLMYLFPEQYIILNNKDISSIRIRKAEFPAHYKEMQIRITYQNKEFRSCSFSKKNFGIVKDKLEKYFPKIHH
jgi:hypothetical protein